MAKQLRSRPSEIYGISDELTAWSFDRAIQTFGGALEQRIQQISEKAKDKATAQRKAQLEVDKWMSSGDTKVVKGRFRDPMAEMR